MSGSGYTADTRSTCDTEEYDIAEHQVPELSEPDVDPVLAAARHVFEEKLDEYLDKEYPDKAQKLLKKGPLTKLYAFYEQYAMEPDKIPFIKFKTNRADEVKALMYSKDFKAIGDIVLQEFKEDVEKYRKEMEDSSTQHSSLTEEESGSGMHGVLLPKSTEGEEDGDEEDEGGYRGGVSLLYRTSASPKPDRGLEPIEEENEDEDGPVFL